MCFAMDVAAMRCCSFVMRLSIDEVVTAPSTAPLALRMAIPMPMITGQITAAGSPITSAVVLSGTVYIIGLIALPFAVETKGLPLPEMEA